MKWPIEGNAALSSLLLAGCGYSKSDSQPLLEMPPIEDPEPPHTPRYDYQYIPEVKFQNLFSPESPVAKLHQMLVDAGVSEAQIDQGCSYKRSDGRGDGGISSCEVQNSLLLHHQTLPKTAREMAGGPIPWVLDEADLENPRGKDSFQKIDEAINFLGDSLKSAGMDPHSPDYQIKMATGLYALAFFPKDPSDFSWMDEEIADVGLKDFETYLNEKGGLGLEYQSPNKGRASMEVMAHKTLSTGKGSDVSISNVLYALFNRAGLKARLGTVPIEKVSKDENWLVHRGDVAFYQHKRYVVQVRAGDQERVYNPVWGDEKITGEDFNPYSPMGFLYRSLAFQLKAMRVFKASDSRVLQETRRLEAIGIKSYFVFEEQGVSLFNLERFKEAEKSLLMCLEKSPLRWKCHSHLGKIYQTRGKTEESLEHFGRSLIEAIPELRFEDLRAMQRLTKRLPNNETAKAMREPLEILSRMKKAHQQNRLYVPQGDIEETPSEIMEKYYQGKD